ncbi:MAG: dockerin type I repeat-containing protein [Clostridia bacterium]|nr:dockerin type I repeat-containing protein [Clostridia bacterium]
MKRFICLLLLLCLMPASSVSAVQNYRLKLSAPVEVNCGEDILLTFALSYIPAEGLCGMDFEIGFDSSMVEFGGVSLSGFPADGNWCYSGRTVNGVYLLYVFDNYDETAGTPHSVYNGSNATVTVRFKTKAGCVGNALFTVEGYDSVTGTSFTEGGPVSVHGTGAENKTVMILPAITADKQGNGWYTKDGVMYVYPYSTAGSLAEVGTLLDENDNPKASADFAKAGDGFNFTDGSRATELRIAMDVNGDGDFTTADYLLVRMHLCGETTLTGTAFNAADVNCDRYISTADLAFVKAMLMGGSL